MKDRFSKHANQYAAFRPLYPAELYDFLYSHVRNFGTAWDAGTGNGQAARELARKFEKVHATDISSKQMVNAVKAENIFYSQSGETINLPQHIVDLITVAQAIHWFDRKKFYDEVNRVGKPGCILALWGYGLLSVNKDIDPLLLDFYVNVVGPYWDKERKLVDEEYRTIEFPFQEIQAPAITFSFQWTLDALQGYLSTWSSVQKFIQAKQVDPVPEVVSKIRPHWKPEKLTITFPMFMRVGRIT